MLRYSHSAMDTDFTVMIAGNEDPRIAASAANACFRRIDELEATLSRFRDDSDVAMIRALPVGKVAGVSPDTVNVIKISAQVASATGGAFDPALGKGFSRLELDCDNLLVRVMSDDGGLALDFGGIGKGYALDECAKILAEENYGIKDFLIDAGKSTVLCSGTAENGAPWRLGVGAAWKERAKFGDVAITDCALSGSGFEVKGNHIFNPLRHDNKARWTHAWSRAESAAVADALSTAAMLLSPQEIEKACNELDAGVMVAREQPLWMDRFRSPLAVFGNFSSE